MNSRTITALSLLTISCFAHAIGDFTSIAQRQETVRETYNALLRKWQPALNKPCDASLQIIIKNKMRVLKDQAVMPFNDSQEAELFGAMQDLDAWPVRVMCEELDNDIQTLFSLTQEARILGMEYSIDIKPFQTLRVQIENLPMFAREQEDQARLTKIYKYYFVPGLVCGAAVYLAYKNDMLPSNVVNFFATKA